MYTTLPANQDLTRFHLQWLMCSEKDGYIGCCRSTMPRKRMIGYAEFVLWNRYDTVNYWAQQSSQVAFLLRAVVQVPLLACWFEPPIGASDLLCDSAMWKTRDHRRPSTKLAKDIGLVYLKLDNFENIERYITTLFSPPVVFGGTDIACVTLPKKILPFNTRGVVFLEPWAAPCSGSGVGTACFFSSGLFLLGFLIPFCTFGGTSLQHKMIFSNKNTWYSRSTSDFVTKNMSSSKSSPKLAMWCPFQSSTRAWRFLTVWSFSALRWASFILSAIRFAASEPSFNSS